MKKWTLIMVLVVWCMFAVLPGPAWSAGLTIGDGGYVTVPEGASISLGCQSLVIEAGGIIDLDTALGLGTIYKCGKLQVDQQGTLNKGDGKIFYCNAIPQIMLLLSD
jgi:hypothetical protein